MSPPQLFLWGQFHVILLHKNVTVTRLPLSLIGGQVRNKASVWLTDSTQSIMGLTVDSNNNNSVQHWKRGESLKSFRVGFMMTDLDLYSLAVNHKTTG